MSKFGPTEVGSITGSGIAVGFSLAEWGVIVGIVTAILTFAINVVYMYRKDQREQRAFEKMKVLEEAAEAEQ